MAASPPATSDWFTFHGNDTDAIARRSRSRSSTTTTCIDLTGLHVLRLRHGQPAGGVSRATRPRRPPRVGLDGLLRGGQLRGVHDPVVPGRGAGMTVATVYLRVDGIGRAGVRRVRPRPTASSSDRFSGRRVSQRGRSRRLQRGRRPALRAGPAFLLSLSRAASSSRSQSQTSPSRSSQCSGDMSGTMDQSRWPPASFRRSRPTPDSDEHHQPAPGRPRACQLCDTPAQAWH